MNAVLNLDRLCARQGWIMAEEAFKAVGKQAENHITKSLGVLQENGVYSFFLYQLSQGSKEKGYPESVRRQSHQLLREAGIKPFDIIENSLEAVRGNSQVAGLANDLDLLLLAKSILEQALIYARYHVKVLGG